ncbi:MAG: HAMP domain-containing histidine kinase [Coriobacteriales bacterium]|nr:HAMP domain-containing histidine kinase [Coriobacteriales bacterium]
MKLWQKIFLLTLALVIIVVNATSLVLLASNHRLSIEREQQNALARHNYLIAELQNTIIYTQLIERTVSLSDDEALSVALGVLERQRNDTTLAVSLFEGEAVVYSVDRQILNEELALLSESDYSSSIVESGEKTYLLIVSTTSFSERPYRLVSSFDISSTYDLFKEDFNQVRVIGIISALIVAGLLLLLVRGLLLPLRNLSGTTRKIAGGDLDNRANVQGHDELAEVARNLNTMADSIEHNITELEKLAESRQIFIGNLAHEMKTPLTSILGFADILRVKREVTDDDRIEYASVIVSETKRLQGLSGKLMELLTMGNIQITAEPVEIHELAAELATTLQPILKNHQIEFACELPEEETWITADDELIKSLIFNLVDNSIKASSPHNTIRFKVKPNTADNTVTLTVADEGVGIAPDQIPLLTEPFYMLDKARTRKHGGAGLGLALCAEIARAHDSRLHIESAPEQGTSVSVVLAKADEHG